LAGGNSSLKQGDILLSTTDLTPDLLFLIPEKRQLLLQVGATSLSVFSGPFEMISEDSLK
jgi:hypothetical protein